MSDIQETIQEVIEAAPASTDKEGKEDRLNSWIAILVALSATFMALCNIKDGNICQAMAETKRRCCRW